MDGQLSLSIIEIVVLMLGAIILGITIHFFITSRKSLKDSMADVTGNKMSRELDDWKRRFFNEVELRDKQIENLQKLAADAEENCTIYAIEAEEVRKQNKKLQQEIEAVKNQLPKSATEKTGYMEQLRLAQSSLLEHNEKINQLLEQIDIVKETEEKQQEVLKYNEELNEEIELLKHKLSQKENEINTIRQKEHLTSEMNSMLDSAYNEFGVLQEKIQKLEAQVAVSKKINLEYEDLKEGYYRISQDYEEQKLKYNQQVSENRQLQAELAETEDKLKEANFQRQQLQKRVTYLEELNNDLQVVTDANKKLEGQLKRIGELESMLNVLAEERDQLAKKQYNA
jgi:chromosome segregation ATPase